MSYCKVVMLGNLARDPELKTLPSGTSVMNTAIAVTDKWTDKQTNVKREEVCFVDISCFGERAEYFTDTGSKGKQVLIEGRLKQDTWESDGNKRSKHRIQIDSFVWTGNKPVAADPTKPTGDGEDFEFF